MTRPRRCCQPEEAGEGCQDLAGRPWPHPALAGQYLVLGDLMGHQLLQEVEVDCVAGLGAAGLGGSLQVGGGGSGPAWL